MMKLRFYFMFGILVSLLSSCEMFQEDCGFRGYLAAEISEDVLPATTEEIQVRYYDAYSGQEYSEKLGEPDYFAANNKFLSRIRTGEYKFLTYSLFSNKVRNVSDINTAEIIADTVYSEKYAMPIISTKQKLVYTDSNTGTILPEDTTHCTFKLQPLVQKIICNITLEGLSAKHEVKKIEAMLSGVITGRKIYTNQPIAEYAGQIFSFIPTEMPNKFTSQVYVFGISNNVANLFRIECIAETFKQYSQVDLSSVLENFTADGMTIDLVVEIGENITANNVYISSWQDFEQGNINFNN